MQIKPINWYAIASLNMVSTLAQLGQFGVGFIVMPIWLAAHDLGALQLGLYAAVGWTGMLTGLLITPNLLLMMSSKWVVLIGLIASTLGFLSISYFTWPVWLLTAFFIGLGMGLRWIANETWLYRISPQAIVGQVVGFHEALIALAVIVGPLLVVWFSTDGYLVVFLGAAFSALAALPLLLVATEKKQNVINIEDKLSFFQLDKITILGITLAVTAGVIDGAFTALFPIFGFGRGFNEAEIGRLMASIGFGGLFLQYPLGWISDKFGFNITCLLVAMVTLLVSLSMAFIAKTFAALNVLSFIFGGFVAMYLTLAIIAAASSKNHHHMIQNMSKVSVAFTSSSILGALLVGLTAQQLGGDALIWLVAVVSGLLALSLLRRFMMHKPA
ncbi:MAG: MFS transporter [Methylophilus sp.]